MDLENLTDKEKDLIAAFNEQPEMVEAVKRVILSCVYENGVIKKGEPHNPLQNWALSLVWAEDNTDEMLGRKLRATAEGVKFIQAGFNKLAEIHTKPDKPKPEPIKAR